MMIAEANDIQFCVLNFTYARVLIRKILWILYKSDVEISAHNKNIIWYTEEKSVGW